LSRLTAAADVIIVNQPQDVLERWRCTYDDIADRNPRAVVVEVSGFGSDGPLGGLPGNGTMAEAFGGAASMIGEADGPPMLPSLPLGDTLAAWSGVMGALAACYWRDARGGSGQRVEVAMYEPVLSLLATAAVAWEPGDPPPLRTGSRVPGGVPRNCYRTSDARHLVISGPTDTQVARILELIGHDTPEDRARFGRSENRLAHGDELDALVAQWVASNTAFDVIDALERARIPVSEANDLATIAEHPQVRHRNSLLRVVDEQLGVITMPAPLPTMSTTTTHIATTGPDLGAHTDDVRREWLG
jgi:formyl-CoA transferase